MAKKVKVIIDYDGTLTPEEEQVGQLAEAAFETLSKEILGLPKARIRRDYQTTKQKLLAAPQKYSWRVNGVPACYCHEGAFVLNTVTIQEMLGKNGFYNGRVEAAFKGSDYDPVTACTNYLFHKNSALLTPKFRQGVKQALVELINHPQIQAIVLTNSKTDKVKRNLETIGITQKGKNNGKFEHEIDILGDTRQYYMDAAWDYHFDHPRHGKIQVLPIDEQFEVDLRRPIYHQALLGQAGDGIKVVTVGDIFSLVGSVPLMLGMDFILFKAPYVPAWSERFVKSHPQGRIIEDIRQLRKELEEILKNG